MTEGTNTFNGLGVPLYGEYEQKQQTAANDMVSLTGASSQTGDFLVCQSSAGSEVFVVDVNGGIQSATLTVTGIATLDFAAANTGTATYAVSGLTSSDVVVVAPREDIGVNGGIVVDKVAAGTLQLRNTASLSANVECNYLVIAAS